MSHLDLIGLPWRVRTSRSHVIGLFILLAGALCAPVSFLQAGSVTLRFDATITHVGVVNPIDLPFGCQVGDVLLGRLTFEPGTGVPIGDDSIEADQFGGLSLFIGGFEVGSSTYSIQVFDNTAIEDSEPFLGVVDTALIACSPTSSLACSPSLIEIPGSAPFAITIRMELTGNGSVLTQPIVTADVGSWNALSYIRTLSVTFSNEVGGIKSVFADVGSFTVVPEPATMLIIAWVAIPTSLVVRSPQRQSRLTRQSGT